MPMTPVSPVMSKDLDTTPAAVTDSEGIPIPKDLDELVSLLHKELGANGLDSEGVDVERVQKLMANYASNPEDWSKYAMFEKGRYTRNLVDDGNGKFNLMILAWPETVGRYVNIDQLPLLLQAVDVFDIVPIFSEALFFLFLIISPAYCCCCSFLFPVLSMTIPALTAS